MIKALFVAIIAVIVVSGCTPAGKPINDGGFHPTIFKIRKGDTAKIQFRQLDAVNAIRTVSGLLPLELSAQLNAAATTHSIDMASNNDPGISVQTGRHPWIALRAPAILAKCWAKIFPKLMKTTPKHCRYG
jgi:uncharacterized protein YkwD